MISLATLGLKRGTVQQINPQDSRGSSPSSLSFYVENLGTLKLTARENESSTANFYASARTPKRYASTQTAPHKRLNILQDLPNDTKSRDAEPGEWSEGTEPAFRRFFFFTSFRMIVNDEP